MRWRATPIPATSCSGRSSIPGLQPRTANGSTGANQFLGQVETGYKLGIYAPARRPLTPFARLQGSTVTQNAFTEWGAQSLNLNVAQQTTNSLRTTFGADLGRRHRARRRPGRSTWRFGWAGMHEYADTGRPITAAFAGAPSNAFTVYGATPQRDAHHRLLGQHRHRRSDLRSTSATTARSAAAPTITPSMSARASPGEMAANSPTLISVGVSRRRRAADFARGRPERERKR